MEKKRCTAIVLAAGQGKRMGTKTQKQYLNLCGYPVLWHCLHTFEESAVIDDMVLVTGEDQIDYCRTEFVEKYGFQKIRKIVAGGAERYHSVLNGLRAMEKMPVKTGMYSFMTGQGLLWMNLCWSGPMQMCVNMKHAWSACR